MSVSGFIRRLSPFWLVVFMGVVFVGLYAVTVPLHELGHILIGMGYGQHVGTVEWFNASAWVQSSIFGRSTVLGYVTMLPPDTTPQESFVQLTLYHGFWNIGMLLVVAYIESRIIKVRLSH